MNFVRGSVLDAVGPEVRLSLGNGRDLAARTRRPPAGPLRVIELGIRPEHLRPTEPGSDAAVIDVRISMLEHLGNTTILYIETDAGQLVVEDDSESAARIGDQIGLAFEASRIHLFGPDGQVQ